MLSNGRWFVICRNWLTECSLPLLEEAHAAQEGLVCPCDLNTDKSPSPQGLKIGDSPQQDLILQSMIPSVKTVIILSRGICSHGGGFEGSHLVYSLLEPRNMSDVLHTTGVDVGRIMGWGIFFCVGTLAVQEGKGFLFRDEESRE
jgi:hypothetical protein